MLTFSKKKLKNIPSFIPLKNELLNLKMKLFIGFKKTNMRYLLFKQTKVSVFVKPDDLYRVRNVLLEKTNTRNLDAKNSFISNI